MIRILTHPLLLIFLALASVVALAARLPNAAPAWAAIDCSITHELRVEIVDIDTEDDDRISQAGALVIIQPDPRDGVGSRTYDDNRSFDDSGLLGRIEEDDACATNGETLYHIELRFEGGFSCDVVEDDQYTQLITDTTVTYRVDDCVSAPTATPTATVTTTPTNTLTPVPTTTPVPTATSAPPVAPTQAFAPQIIVVQPEIVFPTASIPVAAQLPSNISPPRTGDGGLVR